MATALQTETTINWGGVLKGAAIVTAVAVAAVVGLWAFQAGAAALSGAAAGTSTTTLGAIGTSTANGLATAAHWVIGQATWIGGVIKAQWLALPHTLGLSTSLNPTAAVYIAKAGGTSGIVSAAGIIGAITAVAAAIPTAVKALHNISFTKTTTRTVVTPSIPTPASAPVPPTPTFPSHGTSWSGRFTPTRDYGSHADAVRASQPSASTIPQPSDSFAKDIADRTAQLNQSLTK